MNRPLHAVLARVSPGYPPLPGRLLTCYAPVRRSTHLPKEIFALDLHVLGTPPAFVLSQDQTLHFFYLLEGSVGSPDPILLAERSLERPESFRFFYPLFGGKRCPPGAERTRHTPTASYCQKAAARPHIAPRYVFVGCLSYEKTPQLSRGFKAILVSLPTLLPLSTTDDDSSRSTNVKASDSLYHNLPPATDLFDRPDTYTAQPVQGVSDGT